MEDIYFNIDTNKIEDKELVSEIIKSKKILSEKLSLNNFYRFQEISVEILNRQKIKHLEYKWLTKLVLNGALDWTERRVDYGFNDWLEFMYILRNRGLEFDEKIYQDLHDFWNSKKFIQLANNYKVIAEKIVHLINNSNFEYQTFYSKLPTVFFNYLILTISKKSAEQFVEIKNYLQEIETILEISISSGKQEPIFLYALIDAYPEFCKSKNKENFFKKIKNWHYLFNNILSYFPIILKDTINELFKTKYNKLIDYYVYITIKKKLPADYLVNFTNFFKNFSDNKTSIKSINNWVKAISNQSEPLFNMRITISHWLDSQKNYKNFTKEQAAEAIKFTNYFKDNLYDSNLSLLNEHPVLVKGLNESKMSSGYTSKLNIAYNAALYSQSIDKSVRKLEDAPKSLTQEELLRFLFVVYEMPSFMLKKIKRLNNEFERIIFFHVAEGKNLTKLNILPFNVTKREAHIFLNIKEYDTLDIFDQLEPIYTAIEMLIYAKIIVNNGDINFFKIVRSSAIINHLDDMPFWETFFKFYGKNKFFFVRIRELIDYIIFKRYNDPETENFTLKGRTAASISRQTEEWHVSIHYSKNKYFNTKWSGFKKPNFYFDEKSTLITDKNKIEKANYIIKQLNTGEELAKEGYAQRHCVASYSRMCAAGQISLF